MSATGLAHPLGGSEQQRYVPYTPRQARHPSSAHARVQSQSQPQSQPPSNPHLLNNLKSAAKNVGVETTSVGWSILEWIVNEGTAAYSSSTAATNAWLEIWNAISVGSASLVLPLETSAHEDVKIEVTPELVKDHVVFVEQTTTSGSLLRQVVTLSGLRGVLHEDNTLTFRSTLHPTTSKLYNSITHPSSSSSARRYLGFSYLPPLPQPCHLSVPGEQPVPYPSYTILSSSPQLLPLPLTVPKSTPTTKPPLPPRPLAPTSHTTPLPGPPPLSSSSSSPGSSSRIPNPFASLFGVGSSNRPISSRSNSPAMHTVSLPPPTSYPPDDAVAEEQASNENGNDRRGVQIPIFLIDRTIIRNVLAKAVNGAIRTEIARALTSKIVTPKPAVGGEEGEQEEEGDEEFDIPEWVPERVNEFILKIGLYPFVRVHHGQGAENRTKETTAAIHHHHQQHQQRATRLVQAVEVAIAGRGSIKGARADHQHRRGEDFGDGGHYEEYTLATGPEGGHDTLATAVQNFYAELEKEVRVRRERGREKEKANDDDKDEKETDKEEEIEVDKLVKRIVEAVENVVCSLFYDKLFMQPDSDDASHDETLASRVAALNLLDLTLEHLDIDTADAGEELGLVIKACGQTLMQLEACHSPADKAAVLVGAHKVVVDGLSKLPPIRLIPEEESRANRAKHHVESHQHVPKPPFGTELKEMSYKGGEEESEMQAQAEVDTKEVGKEGETNEADQGIVVNQEGKDEASSAASRRPPPLDLSPAPDTKPPRTTVSGDILLPILIFSVVKSNPSHIISHLLFTQRFRNQVVISSTVSTGEEAYCLVNLMAVAEFLENVDLEAMGLIKDGDQPLPSAAELTPIPIARSPVVATAAATVQRGETFSESLRGRVEQQVDAIAGSANKVLTGVMDTSFGMLRSLIPGQRSIPSLPPQLAPSKSSNADQVHQSQTPLLPPPAPSTTSASAPPVADIAASSPETAPVSSGVPWSVIKPGFGLIKRESGFTIASIAASLPLSRGPSSTTTKSPEEVGQQMIDVSRPASSLIEHRGEAEVRGAGESGLVGIRGGEREGGEGGDAGGEGEEEEGEPGEDDEDNMKSIRSFESMMTEGKKSRRKVPSSNLPDGHQTKSTSSSLSRKSLSDRLARVSTIDGTKSSNSPVSSRSSLIPNVTSSGIFDGPSSRPATSQSSSPLRVAPPVQRFLECTPDDLKISEVGTLLREYQRLAEAIKQAGGFSGDTI